MSKLTRILALTAIATIPAGAVAAPASAGKPGDRGGGHGHGGGHGPYNPYEPYEPGPGPGGQPPSATTLARNLRTEAAQGLKSVTAQQLVDRRNPVKLTISVARAGEYLVELDREYRVRGKRVYRSFASGSVTTYSNEIGTRQLTLVATSSARGYVKSTRRTTIELSLRAGFRPRKSRHTTWTPRTSITLGVYEPLKPVKRGKSRR